MMHALLDYISFLGYLLLSLIGLYLFIVAVTLVAVLLDKLLGFDPSQVNITLLYAIVIVGAHVWYFFFR